MANKKVKVLGAVAVGGLAVWGLSLAIAKAMVPERNPVERYRGPIVNARVDSLLEKACFDCHSNETQWPWYSNLPIVSVLIAHDVGEGREMLNFSSWASLDAEKRAKALHKSGEEVSEGEMPMAVYVSMHPEAKLSESERAMLAQLASESERSGN